MNGWLITTFGSTEALAQLTITGLVCGVVGVHVILRRLPFLTMGLSHATFPGLVLAGLLGVNLLAGTMAFGIVVVVAVVLLGAVDQVESASAVGVVTAAGFALGVVLVSASDGFGRDLTAYLVGSVASVSPADVAVTAVAGAGVVALLALFHKELVLGAFDPGALAALGFRVMALDLAMLVALEVTVVTALPALGTILATSLLVAPAATARLWTDGVGSAMALAAALGVALGAGGLALSVAFTTAAGATVALLAGATFAVSVAATTVMRRT